LKPASIKEIKEEVQALSPAALTDIIMRLGRFKKENKELLTYLLLYKQDEEKYIAEIKESLHIMFTEVNVKSAYITKKNLRKILRTLNRFIKYSPENATEIELLLFFVEEFNGLEINIAKNVTLQKLHDSLMTRIEKGIRSLHEDLQYDYNKAFKKLKEA
jgi:hypothetical protein